VLHTHASAAPALVACWFAHLLALGCHGCTHGVASPQPLASRLHKVQVFPSCAGCMGLGNASHTCQCCPSTCGLLVCTPAGPLLPWLHPWGCKSPTFGKQIAQGAGQPKLCWLHGLRECFTYMPVLPQHLCLVGLPSFWPQAAMAAPMGFQVPNPWQADCTRCRSSQAVQAAWA
jgi:hypothetical protein